MARCLVGCGSNVGPRRDYLDRATDLLRFMPGVHVVRVSRYRDTRPIGGPPGQTAFLNGACLLDTDLGPHEVLGMLSAVENTLHRDRGERWGPRTVDLDLLLYDDLVLDTEALTVPHPRMATRRFVLEPSVEIAPDLVHPLAACTLRRLLESISRPHPHVAVIGVPGAGAAEAAAAIAHATLARHVVAPAEYTAVLAAAAGPMRMASAAATAWIDAVEAAGRPLTAERWPKDPHGTVVDYWLQTLRFAARESLGPEPLALFESYFERTQADAVAPHVAILLVAPPERLDERWPTAGTTAFGGSLDRAHGGRHGAAACTDEHGTGRLLAVQERLVESLGRRISVDASEPRAVVRIDASDLDRAVREAVAAVEAMA